MLNTFQAFLQDKKAIKPQPVPFYLKWVSDCYGFLNERLSTPNEMTTLHPSCLAVGG